MVKPRARVVYVQYTIAAVFLNAYPVQPALYQKLFRTVLKFLWFLLKFPLYRFYDVHKFFLEVGLSQDMFGTGTSKM